jgi:hypothetical protein
MFVGYPRMCLWAFPQRAYTHVCTCGHAPHSHITHTRTHTHMCTQTHVRARKHTHTHPCRFPCSPMRPGALLWWTLTGHTSLQLTYWLCCAPSCHRWVAGHGFVGAPVCACVGVRAISQNLMKKSFPRLSHPLVARPWGAGGVGGGGCCFALTHAWCLITFPIPFFVPSAAHLSQQGPS